MTITGNFQDYSREQLINELQELHLINGKLEASYLKDISEKKLIEENLLNRTEFLAAFNQYSINMEDLKGEEMYQFIVTRFRELFKVRTVWISTYNEENSELIIRASTLTDEDNSVVLKYLGQTVKSYRTSVTEEAYKLMMDNPVKSHSSLNDLSFGQIPEIVSLGIQKIFNVGWFQGISLVDKGKLYGTMVVAGNPEQEVPDTDIIKLFAELTSNIIRRKQTEEKLLLSEDRFKKAFVTSPDSININRLEDGLYVSINNGFTKMSGYNEKEVLGKTSRELNIWANPADRDKLVKGLRENGEVKNLESTFRKKNGSLIEGLMSAAIIDLDGVPHILSITRDISGKKEAEQALRKSENKYRELIELAVDGILIGSSDGIIIGANSYMTILTGRSLSDILGMHISDLFEPQSLINNPLRFDILQTGETIISERNILLPDKSMVPVEMHTKMMPDGTYQSIYHDISERIRASEQMKIAKEKAEASDKLKTSFLNNISHEVRTPLNGILGFAELISRKDLSDDERDEAVSMVHESSDRLLKTITNYMDISLLTSGSMTQNKRDFNPSVLLDVLYNKFSSTCSVRNLDLILETNDNDRNIALHADPEMIEKILSHFMDNAVKFTESGSITLGFKCNGTSLEFYVKDTGIGISEKSLDNIFNRFVKEETGLKRISEGSGLGLTIAKEMAEITGGSVNVISDQGKGSIFSLVLQMATAVFDNSEKVPNDLPSVNRGKNTILIAEDDEINFFYMNALLARETDSKIIRAENGRHAVELFKSNNDIKLVLMDIKMPEVDGLEATRQIKLINPHIPVIAITAYAMSGDEEQVMEAGCDGYLSKPVKKEFLLRKMAEVIKS